MNQVRPVLTGLLAAVFSSLLLLGGLSASLAEGLPPFPVLPETPTGTATQNPEALVTIVPRASSTAVVQATPTGARVFTATIRPYLTCPPPDGWTAHIVQADETLENLAQAYLITPARLSEGNCLVASDLTPGTTLYLPAIPATGTASPAPTGTLTSKPISCGPPSGWVTYTVKREDTLYHLSLAFKTSVSQLQLANCLGSSSLIVVGDRLYVPNIPTQSPPTATATQAARTPTQKPSPTDTQPVDTETPVPTPTFTDEPTAQPYPNPTK